MKVPWSVDVPGALLTLLVAEVPEQPTEVYFHGLIPEGQGQLGFRRCTVKVVFAGACAGRLIPGENDMPWDPLAYDLSALPDMAEFWQRPKGLLHDIDRKWLEHGICPDPNFYMVLPSPWIEELYLDTPDLKHFLIVGRYAIAEVLATGWGWERLEDLGPASRGLPAS